MKKTILLLIAVVLALTSSTQSALSVTGSLKKKKMKELESNMVEVTGGTFEMGDNTDREMDSKPAHTVSVKSFLICKYDITQSLWKVVMDTNPNASECDSCPVEKVSWNDVQEFISKLNKLTRKHYRLPSEAEWEYAARGGNRSNKYTFSGSNEIDSVGWNDSNSDNRPHPVAQKKANELGLYDMTGNVLQWCNDWYKNDYYKTSPIHNPHGPEIGKTKVLRGCAWSIYTSYCGVWIRADLTPDSRYDNVGFRLAAD